MSDGLRGMFSFAARGMRDSLLGCLQLYYMDKVEQSTESSMGTDDQPLSTLARRRAVKKQQHRELKKETEPKVIQRILLCCAWNGGLFWLSILVFNGVLIPSLEFLTHVIFGGSATHNVVWSWIGPLLSWTFGALWILPLFVLSKIINSLWFQDIADAAYRKSRGRPQLLPSLSKIIADILFSLLLQSLFLIQGMLASFLPIVALGQLVSLIHMCLLYSLYAFEYKWFNMGWEVHKRLSYIESNWPYFVGFGLPLALLTALPASNVISGCVFSILFPLFIISANEAEPIPETFGFPLRLFSPVVALSNKVFKQSMKKSQLVAGSSGGISQTQDSPKRHQSPKKKKVPTATLR